MAFFDDLGKKISKAGQGVVQKTKDTADTIKLNSAISDEEANIKKLYSQIGTEYFKLHADDAEPALAQLVAGIKASFAKIEECKAQIEVLKGIVKCENCGAELQKGIKFCSSCGAKVEWPEEPAPAARVCGNCGSAVAEGSAFCTACGTKYVEKPARICAKCGATVADNCAFCTTCGTKYGEAQAVASVAEPAVAPVVEPAVAPVVEPAVAPVAEPAVAPVAESVAAPVEKPARICTKCGATVADNCAFCTTCGTKYGEAQAVAPVAEPVVAPVAEPVAAPVETPVAEVKRCHVCNEELEEGCLFCINCGTKIAQ